MRGGATSGDRQQGQEHRRGAQPGLAFGPGEPAAGTAEPGVHEAARAVVYGQRSHGAGRGEEGAVKEQAQGSHTRADVQEVARFRYLVLKT